MQRWFEFVLEGVLLTSISVLGLLGTLLSIRVLLKPSLRDAFSTLLIGLAICDASFLICALLSIGLPNLWTFYRNNVSVHIIPIVYGLTAVTRTGSVYLTMSVTLERFFAIVHPLAKFESKKMLLPASLVFSVVYNLPRFFELKKTKFDMTDETMVVGTELRHDPLYVSLYHVWGKLLVLEAVPYAVVLVLNSLIVHAIWASRRFRSRFINRQAVSRTQERSRSLSRARSAADCHQTVMEMGLRRTSSEANHDIIIRVSDSGVESSSLQQEMSLGLTLVAISALFVFCQFFKIFPDVYEVVCEKAADNSCISSTRFIERMTSLANFFCCLNSAANHLVYMLRGAKFRKAFLDTYKCNNNNNNNGNDDEGETRATSTTRPTSRPHPCPSLHHR